jgi:hypothetical protein
MFVKDAIAGSGIFVLIIVTQVGIFNRCECFSDWGGRMKNPLDWVVEAVLDHKFIKEWLPTVMGGIVLGVILSAVASWWFIIGSRVYLQKSDGRSNLDRLWLVGQPLKSIFRWLERCRLQIKPWKEVKSEVRGVFEEMVSFFIYLVICFRLIGNRKDPEAGFLTEHFSTNTLEAIKRPWLVVVKHEAVVTTTRLSDSREDLDGGIELQTWRKRN